MTSQIMTADSLIQMLEAQFPLHALTEEQRGKVRGLMGAVIEFSNACVEEERNACAEVARNACLVPPDGGSPTEDEVTVCEEAARRILARGQPVDPIHMGPATVAAEPTRHVYLLSDYDEYGSGNVIATLDRSRLPAMLKLMLPRYRLEGTDPEATLSQLLQKTDPELTGIDLLTHGGQNSFGSSPHSLTSGWGGPQLHVVRLDETIGAKP